MNRVIKFKAFDENAKRMSRPFTLNNIHNDIMDEDNDNEGGRIMMPDTWWYSLNNLKVVQFTGLTDKNGIEIYEGDLLRNDHENIITCHFTYFTFANGDEDTSFNPDACEVIGNVYKNPELLETK